MNTRLAVVLVTLCACNSEPLGPPPVGSIATIAGNGESGWGGEGGPATEASLYTPMDVAVGADGRVWISDFNNYQIKTIDDGIMNLVVGTGSLGDSPDPGVPSCPASDAMFNHTPNIVFHDGYLYLAAWHNSRIKRVRLSDMSFENFAGIGRRTLYTGDEGPAAGAAFDLPASIAFAPNGDLTFLDQENEVIRRIDADGVVHRVAGNCVIERGSANVCAILDAPVACPGSERTTRCTTADACSWYCEPGFAGDGGPALEARIGQAYGEGADPGGRMLYDRRGNLVFADTLNGRVRRIDPAGTIESLVAGLDHPVGLALDDDDSLYIAETNANCVRKLDPGGTLTTVAGLCGAVCRAYSPVEDEVCFSGDGGPAIEARLNRPYGIAYADGKLYVADSYNHRIRVVYLR